MNIIQSPLIIHVFRNPLEVATSLNKWNKFSIQFGLSLWETYNKSALAHSANLNRFFIDYNQLIANPSSTIHVLAKHLKNQGVACSDIEDAVNVIDKSLYRQKSDNEGNSKTLITKSQHSIYENLKRKSTTDIDCEDVDINKVKNSL